MTKNLLAITVAGQIKWLREAMITLRDDLDVLVIDDASSEPIKGQLLNLCAERGYAWQTKVKPMGGVNSWNMAYQYFKENDYDNCILGNDDVRFPAGFSKGILEGLEEFDLVGPLSNEPGTGLSQEIRRFVDIKPNEKNIDRVQGILSQRYEKASFRQVNFINGFLLAFSTSIAKFTYNEQFLLNPANINVGNECDFANRINERGGKIAICKTSYIFHWKGKTTEKLDKSGVASGDYREQLWRGESETTLEEGMKIGAILHNVNCSGGVRRFLEIGNEFVSRGIEYTIFCESPQPCRWFDFKGRITGWANIEADYILVGDPRCFGILPKVEGRIFIYVIGGQEHYLQMYRAVYGRFSFILNNRVFSKYFPKAYVVEGGVNTKKFIPKKRTVLFYDTDKEWNRWKHSAEIKKALTGIDSIKLIGLSRLTNEEMAEAYHEGDYFVNWETNPGWSNTSAEALASGLTVVSFGGNCEPFSDRIIKVKNLQELREFFVDPMKEFSWERVADKLLEVFKNG